MSDLFHQLGIDWKLLVSQGTNFLILLIVLTIFVWRPLLQLMRKRQGIIEDGVKKSEEADERLASIKDLQDAKMTEAEQKGLSLIKASEQEGVARKAEILQQAERSAAEVLKNAERVAAQKNQAEFDLLMKQASSIIKTALITTTELDPKRIDDALITKALGALGENKRS